MLHYKTIRTRIIAYKTLVVCLGKVLSLIV